RVLCGVKDLFNFCWTLFVYTKGNFRMIGDDLVNSYHLLLCCLDLVFANAILCPNRRDLLNPSFKGLPADFHAPEMKASEDPPCIIATLCELHDGLLVEAKGIKEHYFKPYISKLFDRKILKGECLLDLCNFTENNKALNKEYEEYVLTVGDFDERVFLGADAEEEIGTPRKFPADLQVGKTAARAHVECHLQQHFEKKRSFAPSTPLTGRRYLREKEAVITPVASATQSVSRLQNIVAGLKNAPSELLMAIFESCARNPAESIVNRVREIGETFCHSYTQPTDELPGSHIDTQPLSPISVHERYSSPTAGSAKRRLFGDDSPKEMQMEKILTEGTKLTIAPASSIAAENVSISPGQTVLTVTTATVAGKAGQKVTIPLHGIASELGGITLIPIAMNLGQAPKIEAQDPCHPQVNQDQEVHLSSGNKPKKTGSLALFYRKVYHLASVRLRDLCLKLDVSNDLRRKIWTCFEFTLVHCADLMKDRHLDQLLLCAFYIMAKVTKEERTFQDIMKSYRNQPQANSHVYRSVLLRNTSANVLLDRNANQDVQMMEDSSEKTGNSLGRSAAENSTEMGTEERGDLIKFYNAVYVGRVKSFALKYDITNQDHVSLKDINNMIKQGEHRSKKRAITIDSDTEPPMKRLCQESDDVLLKRLQDVVSERANH
ncbi:hypothetical protein CIB84_004754, partial [Bambusicola thoracicus]